MHNRTEHDPKTIPALFSFFRLNSDTLLWIENERVKLGWKRVYSGTTYECIQAHMTVIGQTPDVTPALWQAEAAAVILLCNQQEVMMLIKPGIVSYLMEINTRV